MKTKRRAFLQSTAALTGGVLLGMSKKSPGGSVGISNLIKIDKPVHGAILNRRHGVIVNGGLKINIQGEAPLRSEVTVNGVQAKRNGINFIADVVIQNKESEITAVADGWFGQNMHSIRVLWDKNSFPRYRFSIDDNIFFLRDIARNNYDSLFDCFYLKGLRDLNRKYGTKFVLNIYYTDGLEYTDKQEFYITQFPDRYKDEWKDNSNWLSLAFHAYANLPDRPYKFVSVQKFINDLDKVDDQIHRFAGQETCSLITTIHWDLLPPGAYKQLTERGVRVLSGTFRQINGRWDINYFLDDVRSEYISRHGSLMDFDSGIIFSQADLICNSTPVNQIVLILESLVQDPYQAEVFDIFTHEQYFWPFYANYVPDHFQRLEKAIRWMTEHGYKPVFFHEGLMGAPT